MGYLQRHLNYISRNGEIDIENQDGEKLQGKKEVYGQINDWKKLGIPEKSKKREAINIVLSMPAGTPPEAVKNAAREFAAEQFQGHQYAFRCIQTVNALMSRLTHMYTCVY